MFSSLGSGYLVLWVYNLLKSLDHSREYFCYFVLVLLVLVREGLVVVVLGIWYFSFFDSFDFRLKIFSCFGALSSISSSRFFPASFVPAKVVSSA